MASFWFSTPLVVTGRVQAKDGSTLLTATIRPHGYELALGGTMIGVFASVVGWNVRAAAGLCVLSLAGLFVAGTWWMNIAKKSRAIVDALTGACDGAPPADVADGSPN